MKKILSCLTKKNSIETSLGPINGDHLIVIMPYKLSEKAIKKPFFNKVIASLENPKEKSTLLIQVQTFLRVLFKTLIYGSPIEVSTLLDFCPDISTPDEKKRVALLTKNMEKFMTKEFNEARVLFKNRITNHDIKEQTFPISFSLFPIMTLDQYHHILLLDIQFAIEWAYSNLHLDEELDKSCQKITQSALFILNQHLPVFCSQLRCIVALNYISFELKKESSHSFLEEKKTLLVDAQKTMSIKIENTIPLLSLAHIFHYMSYNHELDCKDIFNTLTKTKDRHELNKKIQDIKKIIQEISSIFIKTIYTIYDESDSFFKILSSNPQYKSFEFIKTHFSYDIVKKNIEKAVKEILEKLFLSLKIKKNEMVLKKKYKQMYPLFYQESQLSNAIDSLEKAMDRLASKLIPTKKVINTTTIQQLKRNIEELNLKLRETRKLFQKKFEEKIKQANSFLDQLTNDLSLVLKQHLLCLPYVIKYVSNNMLEDEKQSKPILQQDSFNTSLEKSLRGFSAKKFVHLEFDLRIKKTKSTPILTQEFLLENQLFFESLMRNTPIEGVSLNQLKTLGVQSGQVFMVKKIDFTVENEKYEKRRFSMIPDRINALERWSGVLERKKMEKMMALSLKFKSTEGLKDIHIAVLQRQHQKIKEIIHSGQDVFVSVEKGYPDEENTSLDFAIKNGDTEALDMLFHHAEQSLSEVFIHEKTKYWIFVKALISRQWHLSGYFTFEDFFNSLLQELNEKDISTNITLIPLLVYHKAKEAMELIKHYLSAQKQEKWTSEIKMTVDFYHTDALVLSKKDLKLSLSQNISQDDTVRIQELSNEWIQKILTMTPENLDQIIEKKEDEYLFSTARKTRFNSMTFLQLMIYCGSEEGVTAYLKKIKNNRDKVLKENNECQTVIHFLALKGFWKTAQRLLLTFDQSLTLFSKDYHGKTPLAFAIQEDQKFFIQSMLEKQIKYSDPEEREFQIIQWVHQAVSQNAEQVLLYLIQLKKNSVFSYNHLGLTPLMSAAKANNLTLLKRLIYHSSIDQYSIYGCTALHMAIQEGAIESAVWLIDQGADPQLTDLYSRTALHMAAFKGDLLLMRKIIENKRHSIDQCDFFGNTALHYAAYANHTNAVVFLVKHGLDSQKRNMEQEFNPEFMKSMKDDHKSLFNIDSPLPKYHQSPADMALTQASYLTYLACFDPDHPCLTATELEEELISQLFLSEDICEKIAEHGFTRLLKEKNLQERKLGLQNLLVLLGEIRFFNYANQMLSLQACQELLIEETIFRQDIFFEVVIEKITSDKDFLQTLKIIITKGTPLSLRYFLKHPMLLGYQSGDWNSLIKNAIQSKKEEMTIYLALDPRSKETSFKELGAFALKMKQHHAFITFLLMREDTGFEEYFKDFLKHQVQLKHPRFFLLMICQLELKKKNDPRADILMRMFKFIFKNEKAFFQKEIQLLYFFQDDAGETIFHYLVKQKMGHYAEFLYLLLEEEYIHSLFFLENQKKKCPLTLLLERSLTHQYWDILKTIFKLTTEEINDMKKNKERMKDIILSKKEELLAGYQQKIKQVFDELDEDNYETKLRDLLQEINPHEILKYINAYHQTERHLTDVFFKKEKIALNYLYQEIPEVFQNIAKRYASIRLQRIFEDMIDSYRAEIEMPFFDYLTDLYLFSDSVKSCLYQKPILTLLSKVDDTKKDRLVAKLLEAFFSQGPKFEREFYKIVGVMYQLNDRANLSLFLKKLEEILEKEEVKPERLDEKVYIILNVTFALLPIDSAHFLLKYQHKLKKDAFKNFLLTQKTSIWKNINKIIGSISFFKKQVNHKMGLSFSHTDSVHEFLVLLEKSKLTETQKYQIGIYVLDDYYENKSQSKRRKKHSLDLNQGVTALFHQSDRGCFNKRMPSFEFLNALKMATRWYVRSAQYKIIED